MISILLFSLLHIASSTEESYWWLGNSQSTFLTRYTSHNQCDNDQTCESPILSTSTILSNPNIPPSIQQIFDQNIIEIPIESSLSTKTFNLKYFLKQPVLIKKQYFKKASERWHLTYLQEIAQAEQLNVMVGTSRRIIESGGDGKWSTPLFKFIEYIMHNASQQQIPLYAFDRGHVIGKSSQLKKDLGSMPSFFKHSERTSKKRSKRYKNESWFKNKEETLRYFLLTAGDGSGVQPHAHSDGYNTLIACPANSTCKKLWFLTPPGVNPSPIGEWPIYRDWCCGPTSWIHTVLPALLKKDPVLNERPYFIVQNVGETIYIPENWHHATLALGSFSISVAGQLRIGHNAINRLLWKADYLKRDGKTKQALSIFKEINKRAQQNREGVMKLGICYATIALEQQGKDTKRYQYLDRARGIYMDAIENNKYDINAVASLAEIEYLDGNANESFTFYDQCIKQSISRVGTALYLVGKSRAAVDLDQGKVSRALYILKQALEVCFSDDEAVHLVLPEMSRLLKQMLEIWKERNEKKSTKRTRVVLNRLEKEMSVVEDQMKFAKEIMDMVAIEEDYEW